MKNYNIAIYTRISKKEAKESIINQKNLVEHFLKNKKEFQNSYNFYYCDEGFSGSNFNRPEIKRLLEDIKQGKINCIVVKDLSRFGRNYIQVNDYLDKIFPLFNVRFISINDNYDSNQTKNTSTDLDISFKNIIHTYYIKELALKTKTTKLLKAKNGEHMWKAPFGYKKNKETTKLEIDKENSHIIKMIFNLQDKFNSYIKVCKFLNDNNVKTITENKLCWKSADIMQIVKNEVYIGNTVSFKNKKKVNGNARKILKNKEDEIIRIENTHKPIIDKNLFLRVNSKKNKYNINNRNEPFIFANKLKCGCCGYSLRYYNCLYPSNNTLSKKFYCNTWKQNKNLNCFKEKIFEEDIKIKVLNKLKEEFKINIEIDNRYYLEQKETENLIYNCNKSLKKLNNKKIKIYENYLNEIITKYEYKSEKLKLENLINIENKKLEDLEEQLHNKLEIIINNKNEFKFEEITKDVINKFIDKILVFSENNIVVKLKK